MILARHEKAWDRRHTSPFSVPGWRDGASALQTLAGAKTRERPTATGTFKVQFWDRKGFFFFFFLTKGIEGALVV